MKRIQRKRTAGWRMPPNTVYVGRPTKWGNPYLVEPYGQFSLRQSLKAYRAYMERILLNLPDFLDPLKGKDLACWCPLDKPCHVDVLLEFLSAGSFAKESAREKEAATQ